MIKVTFFVLVDMGEKPEIESGPGEFVAGGLGQIFPGRNQGFQDVPVFPKGMIDVSDEVIAHCMLLIVVGVSAAVITKLFVHSSLNGLPTVETKSFLEFHDQKSNS